MMVLVDRSGAGRFDSFFAAGEILFHSVVEPLFQCGLGAGRDVQKSEPSEPLEVRPRHFGLDFELQGGLWEREFQVRHCALRQCFVQHQGNATFTDVGTDGVQRFPFDYNLYIDFHGLPEIAAPLLQHKIERGMKTAGCIQRADGLLQHEIGAHSKRFLSRGPLAVKHRKGNRVLITGSIPESLQECQSAVQVVAVDDYGVEFVGNQNVGACPNVVADLHINRHLFQCGAEHAHQIGILAQKQGIQGHDEIVEVRTLSPLVTKVMRPQSGSNLC